MKRDSKRSGLRRFFRLSGQSRILPIIIVAIVAGGGFFLKQKQDEKQRKTEQTEKDLRATIDEFSQQAKSELNKDGFIGESGLQATEKMKAVFEKNAGGTDVQSKLSGVMARFLGKVSEEGKSLAATTNQLMEAKAFDLVSYKDKAAIDERRRLANELAAKNRALIAFIGNTSTYMREEMRKAGITGSVAESNLKAFERGQQRQAEHLKKVRETDIQLAKLLLELCDLAEAEMGKFTAKEGGEVIFQNDKAVEKYNSVVEQITKVAQEQSDAQRRMVEAMGK